MSVVWLFAWVLLAGAAPDLFPALSGLDFLVPDLWVAGVLYLALRARGFRAVPWAIALGALRDALSLDPLGTNAFVLGTVAWLFCEGRRVRGPIDGLGRSILTFAAAVAAGWLYLVRILPLEGGVPFGAFVGVFPAAFWTTVAAGFLFPVLDRLHLFDDLCGRPRALSA